MVLRAGRKWRFTCINMTAWPVRPVLKELETSCDVTLDVMKPLVLYIANMFFMSNKLNFVYI